MWQERARALFFMEKKSIREISKMLFKSEKTIQNYFKNYQNTNKKKKKEKKQTDKREKHIKSNGTGKTGQKDTQILAEKVSEGSMT